MYLLEPMCQRKMFLFMLCILMNNKDLSDLVRNAFKVIDSVFFIGAIASRTT